MEMLDSIEKSRAARLAGSWDQYRVLSHRTKTLLRRDKERYVRSLAEDVEGHLNANDLKPVYRALKKLHSKSTYRVSAIQTADVDGQKARWAEYFDLKKVFDLVYHEALWDLLCLRGMPVLRD